MVPPRNGRGWLAAARYSDSRMAARWGASARLLLSFAPGSEQTPGRSGAVPAARRPVETGMAGTKSEGEFGGGRDGRLSA